MADHDALDRTTVDGRPALVAYLGDDFRLTTQDAATLVKVTFLDERGGTIFLTPAPPASKQ